MPNDPPEEEDNLLELKLAIARSKRLREQSESLRADKHGKSDPPAETKGKTEESEEPVKE